MKRKVTIISIMFLIVLMLINTNVFAATGSFQVSAKSKSLTVGGSTTLSITAKECAGVFTVTSSNSSVVAVGSVPDWIEEETKTVTLTAKKAGTATITITASDVGDTDAQAVTGSKTIDITVKEKTTSTDKNTTTNNNTTTTTTKEKSSNAYLSTLGVTPKEYDFSGFSKTKTSYSVTVPSDVDSLKVLYKTADSNATVKVSGNSGFETGSDNKITIKVTAEDGKTTKTYIIKVTKLTEEEEKPGNVIEDEEGLYLTSLGIEGIELSPEFAKDTYSYTATLADASANEVKVVAEANNENAKVDISGNSNLVEGENTINIVVTLNDSSVQTVYQIVLTKEAGEIVPTTTGENNSTTDIIGMFKGYIGIAVGVVVLMIIAVVVLVILLVKENKKGNEEEIEETEAKENKEDNKAEEYNVYENDENEFADNDIEKDNFIESLYKQRNGELDEEDLTEIDKETIEEINRQTEEIFKEKEVKVEGQSAEYSSNEMFDNPLETRKRRRGKGKHSK